MSKYDFKIRLAQSRKEKPEESALGFGKYFTDHMFIMDYDDESGWHDGRIVPYAPISMDPAAMVFHYGQAVFEGLKCYRREDGGLNIFRPLMNFKRLNASDERMCIPHIDEEMALAALTELLKVEAEWVPSAENTSLYIRPFMIAMEPALGVRPSKQYMFIIILSPVGSFYAEGIAPVSLCVEDEYVRAVRGGIGFTKSSANYAASLKAQVKAGKLGVSQVMWLDGVERKYVDEVGAMNVFFKINGEFITPELSGAILPGVTRDSVIQLLKGWGLPVSERKISIDEIFEAHKNGTLEEAFGTGTAAVIAPVNRFVKGDEEIQIGDGKNYEWCKKLYDTLTGIQRGKVKDDFGWVLKIN